MVQRILGSGLARNDKVMVYKCGLMAQSTKVSGKMEKHVARENFGILTAISLKVNGLMIRRTVMAFTHTQTGHTTRDIGRMTCSMVMVRSFGLMEASTSVATFWVRSKAKATTGGLMGASTQASGSIIRLKGREVTFGSMDANT